MTELASEFAAMGGGVKSMYILFCICLRTKESEDVFQLIHMSTETLPVPTTEDPENPL